MKTCMQIITTDKTRHIPVLSVIPSLISVCASIEKMRTPVVKPIIRPGQSAPKCS